MVILATVGILIWSGRTENPLHKSSPNHLTSTHTHKSKSTGAHQRTHPGPQIRSPREDSPSGTSNLGLPSEIERYLDALDDEEAELHYPIARDHVGPAEIEALVQRYHLSDTGQNTARILALLSDLKTADSIASAKTIVLRKNLHVEDPVLVACATSLAKHGRAESIQAILERLNQSPPDDSGHISEDTVPLILSLTLASAPELEWFLGQAAEGKWIATTPTARLAAINALRSYPNIHTTSILARLQNEDASPHIRGVAKDVLARIQQQDSE